MNKGKPYWAECHDRYMFIGLGMIMIPVPHFSTNFLTFARMQTPLLSLQSILEVLHLDTACISLLAQTEGYDSLINARNPEAVYAAIRTIGDTLNVQIRANQLAEDLEERINIITHKLKFIADDSKPTVLCVNTISPVSATHNEYLDNIIRIAGGINYFDSEKEVLNPDILIIQTKVAIPQLLSELPDTLSTQKWSQTNAVSNDNIYVVHDDRYLHRPGADIADDIEILAEIINPKHFIFGRNKDVWMKFSIN